MSFITSAVQSALTGAGTNAAAGQNQKNANVQSAAAGDYGQLNPLIQAQIQQAIAAQPLNQQALANAYMYAGPGSDQAREQMYQNQVDSNTAASQKQANFAARADGLSDGEQEGQDVADQNAANSAVNAYDANVDSPEYHQAQAAQQLSDIAQMQAVPSLQQGGELSGQVYGSPQVQVQPGAGAAIGQILGSYAGTLNGGNDGGDDDDGDDGDDG